MNAYRRRVLAIIESLLRTYRNISTALDFGSGDGWFAFKLKQDSLINHITLIDIVKRKHSFLPPLIYDGDSLPFNNRSFDLVYAIDSLHHCRDPLKSIHEIIRCADKYVLLKDHIYCTPFQKIILCILDEIGNRRFDIPSIYKYQKSWNWLSLFEGLGFELKHLVHPAQCHVGPLGFTTNKLQFIAVWARRKINQ